MQSKPIAAIVVLSLVVASLLVSGCTTSPTSTANQTSTSTATHDAFLEKYLAAYKNTSYANTSVNYTAWEVTWINNTSAQIQDAFYNITDVTWSDDYTVTVFPTTQDATNYLNAFDKTNYSLASTVYTSGGAYQNFTGHAPTVYKRYVWNQENSCGIFAYRSQSIEQLDNIVFIATTKRLF